MNHEARKFAWLTMLGYGTLSGFTVLGLLAAYVENNVAMVVIWALATFFNLWTAVRGFAYWDREGR